MNRSSTSLVDTVGAGAAAPAARADRGAAGSIFNIQRYSIHDGPGIRTTVFFKKCRLRCLWCQNPESQQEQPELFFNAEKCIGCGRCEKVCPEGAITLRDGRSWTDRARCTGAGACVEVCPQGARSLMGRVASVDDIFQEVSEDAIFYQESGGGVTLSGGDPLAQPEFALAILKRCKEAGYHTTLDTCGFASWHAVETIMPYVDLVLYDFKHMDPDKHKQYTGFSNEPILRNAKGIHHELKVPMRARYAVIPGYNDGVENATALADFIANELDRSIPVDLLPFHKYGGAKYQRLERVDELADTSPPSEAALTALRDIFLSRGLTAKIGG